MAARVVSPRVKEVVAASLQAWQGEQMPISRSWVNADVEGLSGEDLAVAKLAIVLAKAPYQVDEAMAEAVLGDTPDEARFIRILAWASFTGARKFTQLIAERTFAARRIGDMAPVPPEMPFGAELAAMTASRARRDGVFVTQTCPSSP